MTSKSSAVQQQETLFGHPTGLFTLFFAEMWERFSFYGMRALLVLYMIKGFLGYNDDDAYGVYGAYTALVYAAPFIGGMLADRLLGARRAVILGGLLMAAGHLLMTLENRMAFFTALSLLICGNGFFKPNISTIVGTLYPKGSHKKDAGFTIFYMGINLGAAMAPIVCGYVGETYGWHYGFGLATAGMLIGVAVFAAPTLLTQVLILVGALGTAVAMPFLQDSMLQLAARIFLAVALATAGVIAVIALGRGGFPKQAGAPPDPAKLSRKLGGLLRADWIVYLGIAGSVPLVALLVQRNSIAGYVLALASVCALAYILHESFFRCGRVERDRVFVALILMFFSFVFWMFFEQAGSSINNFTDRNVDRVLEDRRISEADVGSTLRFRLSPSAAAAAVAALPLLTQEQLGYHCGDEVFAQIERARARKKAKAEEESGPTEQNLQQEQAENQGRAKASGGGVRVSVAVSPSHVAEDGSAKMAFTFTRGGPTADALAVTFDVAGTAMPGVDYTQAGAGSYGDDSGSVTIPAGESSATVTIAPTADDGVEWRETVVIRVTGGEGYLTADPSEATGTIDNDDKVLTITHLTVLREDAGRADAPPEDQTVLWPVKEEHVGMAVGGAEIPTSEFQAVNPIYILLFGLVFSALWGFLDARGWEPSTPVKFALGMFQLGLGFAVLWYGAQAADSRGMVAISWLLLGYLFHTTGELCLSPVGLSMITKLSPAYLVSTMMGAWFLATAISQYVGGEIAKLTGVSEQGVAEQVIPEPIKTVNLYGDVYGMIAIAAVITAIACLLMSPLLTRWMHPEVETEEAPAGDDEEPSAG